MSHKEARPARKSWLRVGQYLTHKGTNYTVLSHITAGEFGDIYEISATNTSEKLALKVEPRVDSDDPLLNKLKNEVDVLTCIQMHTNLALKTHFVRMVDKGATHIFKYIVTELLSYNLLDLKRQMFMEHFTPSTIIQIAHQSLDAIESLHAVGFVHRDIKPTNFAAGRPPNEKKIFLLDFGIARKYVEQDGRIRAPRQSVRFLGTVKYASRTCHYEQEQGRRDDLETWCYFVIEMFRKDNLTWSRMTDRKEIVDLKEWMMTKPDTFEPQLHIPRRFVDIIKLVDRMSFMTNPRYNDIRVLLDELCREEGIDKKAPLDWVRNAKAFEKKREPSEKKKKEPPPLVAVTPPPTTPPPRAIMTPPPQPTPPPQAIMTPPPPTPPPPPPPVDPNEARNALKEKMILLEVEIEEIYKKITKLKAEYEKGITGDKMKDDDVKKLLSVDELEKRKLKREAELAEVVKKLCDMKTADDYKVEIKKIMAIKEKNRKKDNESFKTKRPPPEVSRKEISDNMVWMEKELDRQFENLNNVIYDAEFQSRKRDRLLQQTGNQSSLKLVDKEIAALERNREAYLAKFIEMEGLLIKSYILLGDKRKIEDLREDIQHKLCARHERKKQEKKSKSEKKSKKKGRNYSAAEKENIVLKKKLKRAMKLLNEKTNEEDEMIDMDKLKKNSPPLDAEEIACVSVTGRLPDFNYKEQSAQSPSDQPSPPRDYHKKY